MKLFDTVKYSDFGDEYYFQILSFYPHFSLIEFNFNVDEYIPDEWIPYLMFSFGGHSLFGFSFRWRQFYTRFDLINSEPRNLEYYRRDTSETVYYPPTDLS